VLYGEKIKKLLLSNWIIIDNEGTKTKGAGIVVAKAALFYRFY